jgi:NAD-dependent SIR2 family protein deacetylase
MFVLTGAGCSTASGIPDYRDRKGAWKRDQPVRYQAFLSEEHARRRYWARSFVGWPTVARARPNRAHLALAALERAGHIHQLVTQNVDGLHQRAGQRRVLDLHGRLAWVDCLDCGLRLTRQAVQELLAAANPGAVPMASAVAADGDAEVDGQREAAFRVPGCPRCAGLLKPGVVFFGENVPRPRVELALARLRESGVLLAVGTSLSVYSGFRFCRAAAEAGIPIALVNRGRTRADGLAREKVEGDAGAALWNLTHLLGVEFPPCGEG